MRAAEAEPLGTRVRPRVRPIASGSSPIIRRMSPHRPLPTPMLLGSVERLKRPLHMHPGVGSRLVTVNYWQSAACHSLFLSGSSRFRAHVNRQEKEWSKTEPVEVRGGYESA